MIRYDKKNKLVIFEIHNPQEKSTLAANLTSEYKNAILDLSHLNCSYPEISRIVEEIMGICEIREIPNICIVSRPSLLSTTREYLRVLSGIDHVAFFNHISAAVRYFTSLDR